MSTQPPPQNIAVVLFPGFQLLDICGPLDILNLLSNTHKINLSILAATLDPVSTNRNANSVALGSRCSQAIVPTHTFDTAPDDIEVLIVPGGFGSRAEENIEQVVGFVRRYYARLRWMLTVCTGSAIVAKSGVLDGRRATSNKRAFGWVREQNTAVQWVPKARWVVDGNIWTSSGISAGIDLTFAWVADVYGNEVADLIADASEYERNRDSENDRYAERWGAV
ncbi:class I glutamine amidotransferase-like protein [Pleomassaria siparia CBS 279.74]|uniref:Class I glutamine amidotransferase-like protein n=1 Tax=Pleomassaria siparia CBS 279.74 TaxID=1314801 RepID=A0A6G1KPA3_9PLEO|nr:class I glutamine amidotransferase-like protein [Pleomassaria siparia CBS 279.74]